MGIGKVETCREQKGRERERGESYFSYYVADVWHKPVAATCPVMVSCYQQLYFSWDQGTPFKWCCNLLCRYHNSFKDL